MKDSAAVSFSLSGLFSGILSGESAEVASEAESFFGPDDALIFNRGADPAHPYDTQLEDFFSLDYIEGLRSPVDSIDDIGSGESRSLVLHMDKVRELPEDHPVRRMAEITPEPNPTGVDLDRSREEYDQLESELKEVVREAVEANDGDWGDTWDKMEQDVENVEKTVFEYSDTRREPNDKLEVKIKDNAGLPDAYTNAFFGNKVYHGEKFDAELRDGEAFIQFHDSEFYTSPEKILSEEKYEAVKNGQEAYDDLDRDQKAIFSIYESSPLEKAFNFE